MSKATSMDVTVDSGIVMDIGSSRNYYNFVGTVMDLVVNFPKIDFTIDLNADGLLNAISTVMVFEKTNKKSAVVPTGTIEFPLGKAAHTSNASVKFIDDTGTVRVWCVTSEFATQCKAAFEKKFGLDSSNTDGKKTGKAAWLPPLAGFLLTAKEKDELIYTKHQKFTQPNGGYRGLPFEAFAHSIGASVPPRFHRTIAHQFGAAVDLRLFLMTKCNPNVGLKGNPLAEAAKKLKDKLAEPEQRDLVDAMLTANDQDVWYYANTLARSFNVLKPRLDHFGNMPLCAYMTTKSSDWSGADFHGKWAFSMYNLARGQYKMYLPENFVDFAQDIFTYQTFKCRFEDLGILEQMFGHEFKPRNKWQAPSKKWVVTSANHVLCQVYSRLAKGSQTADGEGKVLQVVAVPAFQGVRRAQLYLEETQVQQDVSISSNLGATITGRLMQKMLRVRNSKETEGQGEFLTMATDEVKRLVATGVLFLNQEPVKDGFDEKSAPKRRRY